ncbi:MAG: iron ABC transporter permease, partial [Armatimonadetes bacterium]|nr:iron ABC transporter permease [Armatimonadota bacterium]
MKFSSLRSGAPRLTIPKAFGTGGILLVVALLPLGWVLLGGMVAAGQITLEGRALLDAVEARLWCRSLLLALLAAGVSLAVGLPYGWLWARGDIPLRRLWAAASLLPLLLPPYALVVAALYIEERSGVGLISPAWSGLALGLPATVGTAALVLAAGHWPAVAWLVALAARGVPRELEDAARLSLSDRRAAWFAAWPSLWPAALAGLTFVFLVAFANYSVGDSLGLPTYAREILMRFKGDFSTATAARLGAAVLAVATPLVLLQRVWLTRVPLAPEGGDRLPYLPLGILRPAAAAFCAGVVLLTAALPVVALIAQALDGGALRLALTDGGEALLQSGALAAGAAGLALALALLAGALAVPTASGQSASYLRPTALDAVVTLPYALPGALLAVGFVALLNRPGPMGNLYGTPAVLLWAYALLFLPYAYWVIVPAWQRIDPDLWDDAVLNGARGWDRWRHVLWPALRGPALLAAALVFLLAAREMDATVVLKPPGLYPLAYAVWDTLHFGSREEAA